MQLLLLINDNYDKYTEKQKKTFFTHMDQISIYGARNLTRKLSYREL